MSRLSANFYILLPGRPGLDPGTLGLKGTSRGLCDVALVDNSHCFRGNGVVSCRSRLVLFLVSLVSWCCGNMRPKMRPVQAHGVALNTRIRPTESETIWSPANPSRFRYRVAQS